MRGLNRRNVLQFDKNDPDTLVGVIARSAGVWDSKCFSSPSDAMLRLDTDDIRHR